MKTKLYTIALLLLLACSAHGAGVTRQLLGVIASKNAGTEEPGGGGCTGDEVMYIEFENSTTITDGTPAGCAAGGWDTTAAATSVSYETTSPAPSSGTYSVLLDDPGDEWVYDVTDTGFDEEGTITFDMHIDSPTNGENVIVPLYYDGSNWIKVEMTGTADELRFRHRGNDSTTDDATTTDCNMTTGNWYSVTVKWRQSGSPYTYIDCGGTAVSGTTAITSFGTAGDTLYVGAHPGTNSFRGNVDNVHVYTTWQ